MKTKLFSCLCIALYLTLSFGAIVHAENVDLSTVPNRDTVQLTIYNSEDITLVRETRKVTFKKGVNPLQFSGANTLIDPTSVELKFKTDPDKLEVLDTTFPREKPSMLYWNVQSQFDGEGTVEISYFTSGITWTADYIGVTDRDEKAMALEGFVRVTNQSGEDYEDAQVRLVVGTINLVETIQSLSAPNTPAVGLETLSRDDLQKRFKESGAARKAMEGAKGQGLFGGGGGGEPKEIVKEGLSEYFIYSVEGTETIPHGWSKRMRSIEAKTVPVKIQYRYRPAEYGDRLVRMYLMTNHADAGLGTTPLPDGAFRVYRDNGREGLSYLVTEAIKYIPIGDKIEINLGEDPEVIFELIKKSVSRRSIWMQLDGADIVRRVDDGVAQIDVNSHVVGWDDHAVFDQRIRNYTAKPIDVEIRRPFDGHIIFRSNLDPKLFDYRTVQFATSIEPSKRADLEYEIITHQGRNARQANVLLEKADAKP